MEWDAEIQNLILTGNVSYELLRPINLYNQWFCRAFALRTAPTILRTIPMFIIVLFLLPKDYGMMLPPTLGALIGCIITTFVALLISCAITNIINICTLWSISGDGIIRLLSAIVIFSSGMIVPLPLFPDWLKNILEIVNSFTYGGVEAAQYPLSIYKSWFRKIFIFVIPLGCINYFPAMAILEKIDPLKSPTWFQWISPIAGIIFFLVSLWVWKFGVKHYQSTGS